MLARHHGRRRGLRHATDHSELRWSSSRCSAHLRRFLGQRLQQHVGLVDVREHPRVAHRFRLDPWLSRRRELVNVVHVIHILVTRFIILLLVVFGLSRRFDLFVVFRRRTMPVFGVPGPLLPFEGSCITLLVSFGEGIRVVLVFVAEKQA